MPITLEISIIQYINLLGRYVIAEEKATKKATKLIPKNTISFIIILYIIYFKYIILWFKKSKTYNQ